MRTIDRGRNVESITWFPDGNAFLSVETDLTDGMVGTVVTKLVSELVRYGCYQAEAFFAEYQG